MGIVYVVVFFHFNQKQCFYEGHLLKSGKLKPEKCNGLICPVFAAPIYHCSISHVMDERILDPDALVDSLWTSTSKGSEPIIILAERCDHIKWINDQAWTKIETDIFPKRTDGSLLKIFGGKDPESGKFIVTSPPETRDFEEKPLQEVRGSMYFDACYDYGASEKANGDYSYETVSIREDANMCEEFRREHGENNEICNNCFHPNCRIY